MMKPTSPTTLAALALIAAGGFLAGRVSLPESSRSQADETPAATKSSRASANNRAEESANAGGRKERATKVSREDRLARLEAIVRGENPLDRSRALLALIDQLGPADFQAAVDHFRSLGLTEERFGEYALLLSAWAKVDPLTALAYARENTGGGFATNTILTTWASTDPEAAIRWAEANHTGEGANPYMAGIIRAIAATDPARATQLLTSLPRSRERGEALDAFLPHLLRQGTEATQSWIATLTDDALRNGAIMRVSDQLAAIDPAGTAAWLLQNPGEATQRRIDNVFSAWARKDEQAAMTSLAGLPAGEIRSNALRGLIRSVAMKDPNAAAAVMDRFPGDVTDRVVRNFVWHSFGNDPSAAISQISRITNEQDRERMYRRTLDAWIERDSAAAANWAQANPLPSAVQEHVNRRLSELGR